MAIKLADTLAPMADFPAVEAKDVAFSDNKTLQDKYDNGELGGGGTADVPIEKIKVNGELQTPVNKVVDITVPDITGLATETYVDNKVADYTKTVDLADVATSGSYNDLADKPTIPSLDGYAKTTDIPTKVSELENDSNYLSSIPEEYVTDTELNAKGYITEHQDISGKVDKVEGKSLISDTEIARLATVDNYDDTDIRTELANKADTDHTHTTVNGHTVESDVPVDAKFTDTVYDDAQVKTQIQAVANGLMDSVGYSADYKTIDIIAKNGVKKSVNVAPIISHASITELSDVDTTNKDNGKALVYNSATSKHEYATISDTDEKVKMDVSTDAKYLGELLDNVTIVNENGKLKVKKLDGQEVTITEINYLKGLTMNVMDLVNMFSNGGVKIINTPVATYAELLTLDKSSFIEGISYLVYVLADENHDNAKTTYLVDKDSETPTYFGFADSQRDFTTNPIDLATEITGKLGIANMDSDAIKALFTVDDTYKTETTTNNAFSTHGAKALYDELLLAIGGKANDSDFTTHRDDTSIHVSTTEKETWNKAQENVIETVNVNGSVLTPTDKAVDITVPTTVAELTDSADYAKVDEVAEKSQIISLTKAEYEALETKDPDVYYAITDDEDFVAITKTISSASTHGEIPTAKAVYANLGEKASGVYSTEEKVIGKWIDGKPLYRKVYRDIDTPIVSTNTSTKTVTVDANFTINNYSLISACGTVKNSNSRTPIPRIYTTEGVTIFIEIFQGSSGLVLNSSGTLFNDRKVDIIVEYTKTTD